MIKKRKFIAFTVACAMLFSQIIYAKAAEVDNNNQTNKTVNNDVREQDDFYDAVNKDWLNTAKIADGKTSNSAFDSVNNSLTEQKKNLMSELIANKKMYGENSDEKKIINLYENYLNKDERNKQGIEPAREILERIKNIKSLDELNDLNKYNISNPLIGFACSVDLKDATKYALYVEQTGLSLGDSDEYTKPTESTAHTKELITNYYIKLLTLTGYTADEAKQKVENMFKLEYMIAPSIIGKEESTKNENAIDESYNVVSIDQLDNLAPNLNIKKYMENLKVDTANKIILGEEKWIKALNDIYKEENLQLFKDYIEINNIAGMAAVLSEDFTKASTEFANEYMGSKGDIPDDEKAISVVNSLLSEPFGRLYINRYFNPQIKTNVENMTSKIIETYKKRIEKLDWMSDKTKANAIEKLNNLNVNIGYPEKWEDYSSVEIKSYDEGGSLLQNALNISKFLYEKQLEKLNSTVDRNEFACPPQMVNAFYNPTSNGITVPAGILQDEFYDINASEERNYGAIGAVIGHEISHAFDNTGAKFDSNGNLNCWWTDEDLSKFQEKTQKVRDYYNKVKTDNGKNVNGDATVGENIADIGGIACVLDILKEKENPNYKDFFESNARIWREIATPEYEDMALKFDVHSPNKIRVNVVLPQFDQFYTTYGVTEKDKMYIKPEDRLQIW